MGLFDRFKKNKQTEADCIISFYSQIRNEDVMKNSGKENLQAFDVAFGKSPELPFFLAVPPGQALQYLEREFVSDEGLKLSFRRIGSYDSGTYAGSSDKYEAYTPDGKLYSEIYVNDYCSETSIKTPFGFKTKYGRVTAATNNLNLNPKTGYVVGTIPDKFLITWDSGDKSGAIEFIKKHILETEQNVRVKQVDIETLSAHPHLDWLSFEDDSLRIEYGLLGYFGAVNHQDDIARCISDPINRMLAFGRLENVYVPLLSDEKLEEFRPCYNARNPDPILDSILSKENLSTWNDVLAEELNIYGFDTMRKNWSNIVNSDIDIFDLDISRAEYLLLHLMKQHSCDETLILEANKLICEIAAVDITDTPRGVTCALDVMKMMRSTGVRYVFYTICCERLNRKLSECNITLEIEPDFAYSLIDSGVHGFGEIREASQELVSSLIGQLDSIKSHSFKNLPAVKDVYRILGELAKI